MGKLSLKLKLDLEKIEKIKNDKIQQIIRTTYSSNLFLFNLESYKLLNSSLSNLKFKPDNTINSKKTVMSGDETQEIESLSKEEQIKMFQLTDEDLIEISKDEDSQAKSENNNPKLEKNKKDYKPVKQEKLEGFNLYTEDYIISTLPTIYPDPIEYKKVEAKYFNDSGFTADEIQFSFSGKYIKDDFLKKLNKIKNDTTVINIGTGDGKSYVAHYLINQYAELGFIVMVASPFIVLTNRDFYELKNVINENIKIVNYGELSSLNVSEYVQADIHCITINSLLGNPGGDSDNPLKEQSEIKKRYLNELKDQCVKDNRKVVFFFDEIHSGIANFKLNFIHNLYRWSNITFKAFVFSATFTEASNVVLGYIAGLTDKKLAIYNCERRKFPQQANLHINITQKRYTSKDISSLNYIMKIVKEALIKKDKVNILIATQSLVHALTSPDSKEPLTEYLCSLEPNILVGKKQNSAQKGRFDPDRINIGTTFNTGVSINDPNSTFIIITPLFIGQDAQKLASIFMEGAPTIIQAFARVRNGGNIHVFMNKPTHLVNGRYQISKPDFLKDTRNARYINSNKQSEIVEYSYKANNEHIRMLGETANIEMDKLFFRTRQDFILSRSQYELASNFEIFGKKVNPFILWAGFTDQFTNCTLRTINLINEPTEKVEVEEETITSDLKELLSPDIKEKVNGLTDKKALYIMFEDIMVTNPKTSDLEIPKKNEIYYKGKLIKHEQIRYYPIFTRTLINILFQLKYDQEIIYDKSNYILGNIDLAKDFKVLDKKDKRNNLKAAYQILEKVRLALNKAVEIGKPLSVDAINNKLEKNLCVALYELRENDFYINKKIFSFLQTYHFTIKDDGLVDFMIINKSKRRLILLKGLVSLFYDSKSKLVRLKNKSFRERRITAIISTPEKKLDFIFD